MRRQAQYLGMETRPSHARQTLEGDTMTKDKPRHDDTQVHGIGINTGRVFHTTSLTVIRSLGWKYIECKGINCPHPH
jgi:hypothetical protein